jgi:hypothetical protein
MFGLMFGMTGIGIAMADMTGEHFPHIHLFRSDIPKS